MFVDEHGNLCLMNSQGTVTYVPTTKTPLVEGHPVIKALKLPTPELAKSLVRSLWDQLQEDESV
jgi:hypothetical protein